jgi:hypothetical protein
MLGKIGVTVAILAVVAIFTAPANAGHKSFVGPADDPFFVDLGAVFDGGQHRQARPPDDRARQLGRPARRDEERGSLAEDRRVIS